jgi:hypothetical protein
MKRFTNTSTLTRLKAARFEQMFSDGVWSVAAKASKTDTEKMRALAKSKGMSQ